MVEEKTEKRYFLTERLYLNADKTAVLKEGEPGAAYLFGGVGAEVSAEDVEKYGLKQITEEVPPITTSEAPQPEPKEAESGDEDAGATLKGKLPEDFPGYTALTEAGITTYAKLRKAGELTEIPGIGKATAQKITEALEE